MTADGPLFDSTREALLFALNADRVDMPVPMMTRAMSRPGPEIIKAPSSSSRPQAFLADADGQPVSLKRPAVPRQLTLKPAMPTGLDKSAQAGFILATLQRLDREHVAVLTGLLARSADPCPCQRPCCSGWLPNPRWRGAIAETCEILRDQADLLRKPGVKGLGTHPGLREAIVGSYFKKKKLTLERLSESAGITEMTAAKHRGLIEGWLQRTEQKAWEEADLVFFSAGIVGSLEG